jgi:hypothetical protein
MTTCPACNTSVDPLRARFVGVHDGKIVAYCSAECAAKLRPAAPAAAARTVAPVAATPVPTPAARTVVPAAPTQVSTPASGVPVRVATPSSGVPVRVATPARGVAVGPPRPGTPPPGVPITIDSGPVIEILHEPASGVVTSARDARSEPRARHPDEIPIAEFWTADREKAVAVEAVDPESSAPAPAVTAGREAGGELESAPAHEPSDRASSDADLVLAPRRRRWPMILLVVVLLGGGGYLLYRYLVDNGFSAATQLRPVPVASVAPAARAGPASPVRPVEPRRIDATAAVDQARTALHRDLAATSPRVRRLAAAALARTQDAEACGLLAAELAAPSGDLATSEIARLDLAYALARGGDRRGAEILAGALGASRAEARDEASRLLALLGDRRAVPHLLDLLAVDQRRLGAAEHLAHLGEPHAIKVLDRVRGDPRASVDDKARATVALGIAGRADVAGALHDMLGDPHFNAFAAEALVVLGDRSARAVLEHQLVSPPLRVLAARALRRLDPAIDPGPLLPSLLDVVRSGREFDRIPAAEAILILAGPAGWSAFD